MTTADERADVETPADGPNPVAECPVTVHRTRPDRRVFTEVDNADGWISTDLTVRLRR